MNEGRVVKDETRVVYSENGNPYTIHVIVKRGCSDDPEKALDNFLRTCGRLAENVERRLAQQEEMKAKEVSKE